MGKTDSETTIQELKDLVEKFGQDRHWQRHHTPKNLSMNIAIEAAELMEHYVWDRAGEPDKQEVADELADVLFNVLNFAISEHIDVSTSFKSKYQRLLKKYPVETFNKNQDSLADYKRVKIAYRAKAKPKLSK